MTRPDLSYAAGSRPSLCRNLDKSTLKHSNESFATSVELATMELRSDQVILQYWLGILTRTGATLRQAISWQAKSQPTVSLSTAEAELMAAARAAQEALYLRHLLLDLGYEQMEPTVIYEDNQACIAMSKNPTQRERCRHIDSRDNFIGDLVEKRQVEMKYMKMDEMAADLMTKGLPRALHQKHTKFILGSAD
eukprot:3428173-Rhodomonas_salina.1